jgi:MFS family permease
MLLLLLLLIIDLFTHLTTAADASVISIKVTITITAVHSPLLMLLILLLVTHLTTACHSHLPGSSLIIIGGFISAFCPNYPSFIVCRALVSFGVGGISVPFDLLAEYLPTSHRGKFLMYIEYFWTIGKRRYWYVRIQGGGKNNDTL